MTERKPVSNEVKLWWIEDNEANREVPPDYVKPEYIEVMLVADHCLIVAELKAQLEQSETKVGWLLRDNERVAKEKDAEINRLNYELDKSRDSNIAVIAKQAKVIEKLKTYVQHRADCICRSGVLQYSNDCDCGLAAIERGEG